MRGFLYAFLVAATTFAAVPAAMLACVSPAAAQEDALARQEELRQAVMRLMRRQVGQMVEPLQRAMLRAENPRNRVLINETVRRLIGNGLDIAVGPNPEVNLLDAVVMLSLAPHGIERQWSDKAAPEDVAPVVESFRRAERDAWRVAADYMSPEQQAELRRLIERWLAEHPDVTNVESVRFSEFARTFTDSPLVRREGGSLFLPEVARAMETADEMRLLSERMLFLVQLMPAVLRLDVRGSLQDTYADPQTQRILDDFERLVVTLERLADTAERMPDVIAREREAAVRDAFDRIGTERETAIRQFAETVGTERQAAFQDLRDNEPTLTRLMEQASETLAVGAEMAANIEKTTAHLDAITARQADAAAAAPGEPLDLQAVRAMLHEVSFTASELNEMMASVREVTLLEAEQGRKTGLALTLDRLDAEVTELLLLLTGLAILAILVMVAGVFGGLILYRHWLIRYEGRLAAKSGPSTGTPQG